MIAIITSAHVPWRLWLRSRHNRILSDIHKHRGLRKRQLIECLESLVQYRHLFSDVYLLECVAPRVPSYLRKIDRLKCVAATNQSNSPNKGIKEFVNLAHWIGASGIGEDERIFKLTGRYILSSDAFPVFCKQSLADVVAKKDNELWGTQGKGVHTFMFSSRAKIILSFADWLMEGDRHVSIGTTPVEWIFLQYLTEQKIAVDFYTDKMFLQVNYAPPAEGKIV